MKPWSKNLRQVHPYIPGEQNKNPNKIKLNANENPYPPSPQVMAAIHGIQAQQLNLYPPLDMGGLEDALAKHYGVCKNQVMVGNGSDDILALCFMAFFNSRKPIFFPDVTYSFYPVWCELFQIPYQKQSVDKDFRLYAPDYYGENGGVIFPNPNAPTSIGEGETFLRDILDHNQDVIVIIDEAYVDFGGFSAVELIKDYENLVVVQTFSKSRSLAGLRIGTALGHPDLIGLLHAVKNSYNSYPVDSIALAAAKASIEDDTYFRDTLAQVIATRQASIPRLEALGFQVYPSQTNFLFVTHSNYDAKTIYEGAKKANIFIRYFNMPRIDNHLRITIGTESQMEALFQFLENFLSY